jgi:predicted Zn-ribbon and HTH transcriptional regulator
MGKTINEVELSKENISDEQLNWMSQPDTCPACGYTVDIHTTICPDCGLRL